MFKQRKEKKSHIATWLTSSFYRVHFKDHTDCTLIVGDHIPRNIEDIPEEYYEDQLVPKFNLTLMHVYPEFLIESFPIPTNQVTKLIVSIKRLVGEKVYENALRNTSRLKRLQQEKHQILYFRRDIHKLYDKAVIELSELNHQNYEISSKQLSYNLTNIRWMKNSLIKNQRLWTEKGGELIQKINQLIFIGIDENSHYPVIGFYKDYSSYSYVFPLVDFGEALLTSLLTIVLCPPDEKHAKNIDTFYSNMDYYNAKFNQNIEYVSLSNLSYYHILEQMEVQQ